MFEGIIGNEKVKNELTQAVNLNKTSHSYLFIGSEGIGKKLIAKEFAKMLLCLDKNKYCNKCKSCVSFNSDNNPDFVQIEPDGNNVKIEQIRNIQKKILEAPITSEKKVYIINNADMMTKEAQNCLLKTLEEPPEFVTIILIGAVEENFLSTIKSRCTIIKFQDITNEEIIKYLKEKHGISNVTENMLEIFQGSIGRVEQFKDKEELYNTIYEIITEIKNKDIIDILKQAEILYKNQENKKEILDYMNVISFSKSKEDIRYINFIEIIEDTKKRLEANSNYNMCIDNMLFKIWEEMH